MSAFSFARSRDLVDIRPQAVVAAPEAELGRPALQLDGRVHLLDLAPRHAYAPSAADPAGEASDPAGTLRPPAGADEDRDHFVAFDSEIADVSTASAVPVEQLAVEHRQRDVHLLAQFSPTFVSTTSGTA